MSTLVELCAAPITTADGVPLGYLDWRFVVQIALSPSPAVLGNFILGTDVLSSVEWQDVTGLVEGVSWVRGAAAGDRPLAGELRLTIADDAGDFAPTVSPYHGPGTLVRVVVGNDHRSYPQITAVVDSWDERTDAVENVRWVEVVAIETSYLLGEVDEPEQALAGAGDTIADRVNRILDLARWQYPATVDVDAPHASWGFQSTNLAQDLLTELYLVVDSLDVVAFPAKAGGIEIAERSRGYVEILDGILGNFILGTDVLSAAQVLRTLGVDVPIVADSLVTRNDDEALLSSVSLARSGGSAVSYESTAGVAGRYQRRSSKRYDLITQNPGGNADLARVAAGMLSRGDQTYRPVSVVVDSGHGGPAIEFLARADLGSEVDVAGPGGVTFTAYLVWQMTHSITPLVDGVAWSGAFGFDLSNDSEWSN